MDLKIGSIVRLKTICLWCPKGTIGVVFNLYHIGLSTGIQVIFPNGTYDGFSDIEQKEYLEHIGESQDEKIINYHFTNACQLSWDFDKGLFNSTLGNKR